MVSRNKQLRHLLSGSPSTAPFCQTFYFHGVNAIGYGCGSSQNTWTQTAFLDAHRNRLELRAKSSQTAFTHSTRITSTTAPLDYPACSSILYAITSCELASPGFTTMLATDQQSCLCNSTPDSFETEASRCATYLLTAAPYLYTDFSYLKNECGLQGATSTKTGGGGIGATIGGSRHTSATPIQTSRPNSGATSGTTSGATSGATSTVGANPPGPKANGLHGNYNPVDVKSEILTWTDLSPKEIGGISSGCAILALICGFA
jgi:hypothetical protein